MAPQFTLKNVMPPPLNCSKKLSTTVKYSQIFRAPPLLRLIMTAPYHSYKYAAIMRMKLPVMKLQFKCWGPDKVFNKFVFYT